MFRSWIKLKILKVYSLFYFFFNFTMLNIKENKNERFYFLSAFTILFTTPRLVWFTLNVSQWNVASMSNKSMSIKC